VDACYELGMELGAVFPTNEIGNDPIAIRDWAQAAEALGFTTIITYDHVLGAPHDREPKLLGPYTQDDPFHEPFVLFGFFAACTSRILLQIGVLIAPQRQTALVAKQAAEVDVLSGGRIVLGLGTGWNYVEYDALGMPFASRGKYLDEQTVVLRRLFTEPVVDFSGSFHRIDRAGILPLPTRQIPLWIGGSSPPSLRRAARLGDGYIFGSAGPRIHGLMAQLHEQLVAEGRDPASFPATAIVDHAIGPDGWRAERDAFAAAGGTQLALQTMDIIARWRGGTPNGFTTPAQHIGALERYAAAMED
jgi:probable F420-dependent oxidoreductase